MSATPTVQAAFSMPGRSLQVLPVGLGVFGSITGITIIIVALVTLERIRYRRVSPPCNMCNHLLIGYPTGLQGA